MTKAKRWRVTYQPLTPELEAYLEAYMGWVFGNTECLSYIPGRMDERSFTNLPLAEDPQPGEHRILVDKTRQRIRFEQETERSVIVVIEPKEPKERIVDES